MLLTRLAVTTTAALLALTAAPTASANPADWPTPGSQPADAILMALENQGYAVGINWVNNGIGVPLARCQVAGYHSPDRSGSTDPGSTTVYVDVVCPDED